MRRAPKRMKIFGLGIIALLFIYIYSPPLVQFEFGPVKFVAAFAWAYLLLLERAQLFKFLGVGTVRVCIICLVLCLLYSVGVDALSEWKIVRSYSIALFLFEVIPSALFLSIIIADFSPQDDYIILKFLVAVAVVQGMIALFLFFFPSLNFVINGEMLRHGQGGELSMFRYDYAEYRGFGISGNYFFSMPVFQSIAILCCIVLGQRFNGFYVVAIALILPAITLNARIGLITTAIAVLGMTLFEFFRRGRGKGFWIASLILLLLFGLNLIVQEESKNADSRFRKNLGWIGSMATDSSIESAVDFLFVPKNIWLGDGRDIFLIPDEDFRSSDNGYVQSMFYGGIVFCLFEYGAFAAIGSGGLKSATDERIKDMMVILLVMLIICNFKGDIFGSSNETTRGIALLSIFYIYKGTSFFSAIDGRKNALTRDNMARSFILR